MVHRAEVGFEWCVGGGEGWGAKVTVFIVILSGTAPPP